MTVKFLNPMRISANCYPVVFACHGTNGPDKREMIMKKLISPMVLMLILMASMSMIAGTFTSGQSKLGPKDGESLPAADLDRVKPGDEAPDFTLENIDGMPITLSDYRDAKSVVLVFYRGYW